MGRLKIAISLVILLVVAGAVILFSAPARSEGPLQPIEYSHRLHVTDENGPQLECTVCHAHTDKSRYATIPNIATCMVCHESVKTESAEVQKLAGYSGRHEQPPWVRVYWFLPSADVYFTHKPHVKAGLDCTVCHGQVGLIDRQRRMVDQTMGWCIDCHQEQKVSNDCNVCHR